jgi:hypothetical protein
LALASIAMVMLMIGIGLIVAYTLGAAGPAGLLSGGAAALVAAAGLVVADPPATPVERPRPEYPLAEAAQGVFASELRWMLAQVRPLRLDAARSSLAGDSGVFVLAHDAKPEWDVEVAVDEHQIVVFAAGAHEHFFTDERRHAVEAVTLVAELLRGEVEVERTFRGRFLTKVSHWRRDGSSVRTVLLTGAHLMVFLRRRVERERPDFEAEG